MNFNVVPNDNIKSDCLLERNFLSHPRVILSVSDGKFVISFKRSYSIPFDEILSVDYDNSDDDKTVNFELDVENTLPVETKIKIKQIYYDSYLNREHVTDRINDCPSEMNIQLKTDNVFYFRPRRLSFYEKDCLQKILDDMLSKGIIQSSTSDIVSEEEKWQDKIVCRLSRAK